MSLGFLVWQVPLPHPFTCCRMQPVNLTQLGGWSEYISAGCISAGCISVGCRQGAASYCDAKVQACCHVRVPFCHRSRSVLAFKPRFAAILSPWGIFLPCCKDTLCCRPCRLRGRFETLDVFAKRTAGFFYWLFFALFFLHLIELLHLTCLILFFVIYK